MSFDRPYAWAAPGGQGPLGWEMPFVRFVERLGYDVTYQSDAYTDAHPASLLRHRLVAVAGHSEYWSRTMRDAFNGARDQGVNLAFMGANDAYWQVRLEDAGRTIVAYKSRYDPNPDPALKTAMFRELTPPRQGRQCRRDALRRPVGRRGVSERLAPVRLGARRLRRCARERRGFVDRRLQRFMRNALDSLTR